jgi:hypothetical protein
MKTISRNDRPSAGILLPSSLFLADFIGHKIARASHTTKTKGVPFQVAFCYLINF